jgi:hypothetical protein
LVVECGGNLVVWQVQNGLLVEKVEEGMEEGL